MVEVLIPKMKQHLDLGDFYMKLNNLMLVIITSNNHYLILEFNI